MKHIFKILFIFIGCLVLSLTCTNYNILASTVYDVSCTSTTHSYSGITHYFVVNGECKVTSSDRTVQNISTQWKSSGTGSYTVTGSTISNYQNGNYKKYYSGTSTIVKGTSANSTTSTEKCDAILTY